jgi:tRNA G10  N-methylase Trm11
MKYLFILGRNPELSIAEIISYLEKEGIKIKNHQVVDNSLLIEIEKELEKGAINKLGGTISLGIVLSKVEQKELDKLNIYIGTSNKLNYVIWNFSKDNSYNKISDYLKKRFREEELKATHKNLTGSLELQDGKQVRISSGLIDEEYFVFEDLFGKIIEKCDYKKLESRDMEKPNRRESLAISPRLAKIMINLSETKKGGVIVDPFCGIGVILQEALLQGIKVVGVDNDKEAIDGARKNLSWLKIENKNYQLINEDSRNVKIKEANALVTEPYLGETLNKTPSHEKAGEILREYENLIASVLNNLKNNIRGKFVFTAPFILVNNRKRASISVESIIKRTDLKLTSRFQEFRENQIVGREIFVMDKV